MKNDLPETLDISEVGTPEQEGVYHGTHGSIYFEVESQDDKKQYQKFSETIEYRLYMENTLSPDNWDISFDGVINSDRIVTELIPLRKYQKPIGIQLVFDKTTFIGKCKVIGLILSVPGDGVVNYTLSLKGVDKLVVSSSNSDIVTDSIVDKLKEYNW